MSQNTDLALYYTREQVDTKLEAGGAGTGSGTTHAEPLTDGIGDLIFAAGDVIMVLGVSN